MRSDYLEIYYYRTWNIRFYQWESTWPHSFDKFLMNWDIQLIYFFMYRELCGQVSEWGNQWPKPLHFSSYLRLAGKSFTKPPPQIKQTIPLASSSLSGANPAALGMEPGHHKRGWPTSQGPHTQQQSERWTSCGWFQMSGTELEKLWWISKWASGSDQWPLQVIYWPSHLLERGLLCQIRMRWECLMETFTDLLFRSWRKDGTCPFLVTALKCKSILCLNQSTSHPDLTTSL